MKTVGTGTLHKKYKTAQLDSWRCWSSTPQSLPHLSSEFKPWNVLCVQCCASV